MIRNKETASRRGLARSLAILAMASLAAACTAEGGDPPSGREAASAPPPVAATVPSDKVQERRPRAGTAWVIFAADTVVAEVARTADERAKGLMYRDEIPDGTGMIFVFDDVQIRSFWMQNTYAALDIAYMDASFKVVDIQQMAPLTTDPHESAAPAMFALEVRQGWFAEHGVRVGDVPKVVFGL